MQDSIIIYSNPVEKAFWESVMGVGSTSVGSYISAVIIGCITFLVAFILLHRVVEAVTRGKYEYGPRGKYIPYIEIAVAGLVTGAVISWLKINYYLW